ncbi:MAG TPA: glycosyltransferase family 4 protein [Thermoanaerobaculia bacterium]|nr:glycosyltransferase family 4 protein [Thermoanaerobaculia bacterium]
MPAESPRVGYVLKRYPRYSETFIVNEILAHERAGVEVEIFALGRPSEPVLGPTARVRAPVTYLLPPDTESKSGDERTLTAHEFWLALREAARLRPEVWEILPQARLERSRHVYQALLLAVEAASRGVSHLHAHFATSATTVARLAAAFADLPYTFTCHAKDIFHESVQVDDLEAKFSAAAPAVTVSDFNMAYLRATVGPVAGRLRRIYNGLDLADFPYRAPDERRPLVLAVGRLVEKKGLADLVEACAILERRGVSFDCRIVGSGELEEGLRSRIARHGLGDRVALTGAQPRGEVVRSIQEAAVLAAPCVVGDDGNRDGLPTVLLEAMALGTPCVSTDVTGIPEVLRDGETGLMVPPRNPEALAAAIERLLEDAVLRVALAGRARRRIESDFDVHRNTEQLRELFCAAAPVREEALEEAAG